MAEATREEWLEFAKKRAIAFVEAGDINQAFESLYSDFGKHKETEHLRGTMLHFTFPQVFTGELDNPQVAISHINKFM